jgi:hypothetical protein
MTASSRFFALSRCGEWSPVKEIGDASLVILRLGVNAAEMAAETL